MKASKLISGLSAAALALSCMSFVGFAEDAVVLNSFEATKENVKIIGRAKYMESADALWFGLTDTGCEFKFTGTQATVSLSADSAASSDSSPARVALYGDGKLVRDTTMLIKDRELTVTFDESGEHTVKLLKLSECPNGTLRINEIKVDSDKIEPTAAAEKKIEFIGDSITCGYGVDGASNTSFSTTTEDGTKTYAYKTAQKFNADYSMVSYSGYGIISGYSTNGERASAQALPQYYDKLGNSWGSFSDGLFVQKELWDASEFTPDLVVINLGTNDASYMNSIKDAEKKESEKQAYTDEYVNFIKTIRATHPDAEILCVLGIMGQDLYPQVETAVKNYTEETGDTHVNAFQFNVQNTEANGTGSDWHPAPQSHVDAAYELIDEIQRLYEWVPDDSVSIEVPIERKLGATIEKEMTISNDGTLVELPVKLTDENPEGEEITYTIEDDTVVAFAADSTAVTDAEGKASVQVKGVAAGKTTVTASTADGLSTTFTITVEAAPDSSSDVDSSSNTDTSSDDSTASSSQSSSSSSSAASSSSKSSSAANSSKSNSSAANSSKSNTTDTNPATGAGAAGLAAVVLAMGALVVSKKNKQ